MPSFHKFKLLRGRFPIYSYKSSKNSRVWKRLVNSWHVQISLRALKSTWTDNCILTLVRKRFLKMEVFINELNKAKRWSF